MFEGADIFITVVQPLASVSAQRVLSAAERMRLSSA
jgi:hypothetical protein